MIKRTFIVLFLIFAVNIFICESKSADENVYGELNLQNIYRDAGTPADGVRFFRSLTYDDASNSLTYIMKAIDSYQEIMKKKDIEDDFEKQIGIGNNYYLILFTMMKQNYLINKYEYNIAEYKYKLKEINKAELKRKEEKYKKVKKNFEEHYNSVSLGE